MSRLLEIAASNIALAGLLALVAWGVSRWGRRPALAHGLWVLVLLKLITPPLATVPLLPRSAPEPAVEEIPGAVVSEAEAPPSPKAEVEDLPLVEGPFAWNELPSAPAVAEAEQVESTVPDGLVPREAPRATATAPLALPPVRESANPPTIAWWPAAPAGIWLAGTLLWFGVAGVRLVRFSRWLNQGRSASDDLQGEVRDLADRLGVSCPQLWLVPGKLSPMLWVLGGRPLLVVPTALLEKIDSDQRAALLLHELAHWKRGDHLVRRLEAVVLGLYWWCPLVWWARRHLVEAEEACCDAWVLWALPEAARAYAEALVDTVDFLSEVPALPPLASGLGPVTFLKRRLTMILRGRTPRALTLGGLTLLALAAAALLPWVPGWVEAQDRERKEREFDKKEKKEFPMKKEFDREEREKKDFPPRKKEFERGEKKDFPGGELEQHMRRLHEEFQERRRRLEMEMRELEEVFRNRMRELHERFGQRPPFERPPFGRKEEGKKEGFRPEGGPRGDLEQRLNMLERKLDMLMERLMRGRDGQNPPPPPPPPRREGKGDAPPLPKFERKREGDRPAPPRREGDRKGEGERKREGQRNQEGENRQEGNQERRREGQVEIELEIGRAAPEVLPQPALR